MYGCDSITVLEQFKSSVAKTAEKAASVAMETDIVTNEATTEVLTNFLAANAGPEQCKWRDTPPASGTKNTK